MLDTILQKHLEKPSNPVGCVVSSWITSLSESEQDALHKLQQLKSLVIADLYRDLQTTGDLPFKLTAFRSHMRGYCTCPRN